MLKFIRQAWLVIVLGLVFGVSLAGVSSKLQPIIEKNEAQRQQSAARKVFASRGGDPNALTVEKLDVTWEDPSGAGAPASKTATVYRVSRPGGELVGWAVPAQGAGYADTIKLIVGVTPDARKITGLEVIYNQETPGLGNKITTADFRKHFVDKSVRVKLTASKKSGPPGEHEIQAVTGATISSDAVCAIIHKQLVEQGLAERLAAEADKAEAKASHGH